MFIYSVYLHRKKSKVETKNKKQKKKRKVGYEVRKERKKVNNVLIFPVQSISFLTSFLSPLPA